MFKILVTAFFLLLTIFNFITLWRLDINEKAILKLHTHIVTICENLDGCSITTED